MPNWRARVKLPASLDTGIRNHAIKAELTLKVAVQEMIDDGVEAIRRDGTTYQFTYPAAWAIACEEFEYVLDDSYRLKINSVTAGIKGQGKLGKALAETILVGARARGLRT